MGKTPPFLYIIVVVVTLTILEFVGKIRYITYYKRYYFVMLAVVVRRVVGIFRFFFISYYSILYIFFRIFKAKAWIGIEME